jgi:histidine ammonia-lyase
MIVKLSTSGLRPEDVLSVARGGALIELTAEAIDAMSRSRSRVEELAASQTPVYGVSTGFGALATRHIPASRRKDLQRSLIRSHAAGTGDEVEVEVVRAMMLLRLATLASGRTGVRPSVAMAYASALNAGITPIVAEYGSLGCSGDLAPLAHTALFMMGEGQGRDRSGQLCPAAELLELSGIQPLELEEKEGLALVNGTDGMLGMLVLAVSDLTALCKTSDLAASMSVEALLGTDRVFAADLHEPLRPHPGQAVAADNMWRLLRGSEIVGSHRWGDARVQDAYSLRCAPQVSGAVRDTLSHASAVLERELSATVDNPIVLADGRVESNGNFHGAPLAYVADFLAIVAADLASMSERRSDRMLDPARSHGLPPFLADDPGVDSGYMIAQYCAAAIVSELKRLASPASVDSIPSSAMQEDHVSMGWAAARKLRRSLDGLRRVVAIEVLLSARALDLRAPLEPARATAAARDELRRSVAGPGPDRWVAPEVDAAVSAVASGRLLGAAEAVCGKLG